MDILSDEFFDEACTRAQERVSERRYAHMQGVSDTAVRLAREYDVDWRKARLAGILHDWDKDYRNKEIRARARELGLEDEIGPWVVENLPEVLHGPTAAKALSLVYPDLPDDILSAIAKHTTADIDMSDLDKVIYIADAIEPHRRFDVVAELRSKIGQVSLDELYFEVYKFWIMALLQHDNVLHPKTMEIWNALTEEKTKKRQERFE